MQTAIFNRVFAKKIFIFGFFLSICFSVPKVFAADGLELSVKVTNLSVTATAVYTTSGTTGCDGSMSVNNGVSITSTTPPPFQKAKTVFWGAQSGQTQTFTVTGLQKNTQYYAIAECSKGTYPYNTQYKKSIPFTTGSLPVPPKPTPSNQSPVADAGIDKTIIMPEDEVKLEGRGVDPDGTIKTYQWNKNSGSGTIYAPTSATTTITGLTEGVSVFQLGVTDNKGAGATDTVTVTVKAKADEQPPKEDEKVVTSTPATGSNQCNDGQDNDKDGKADQYGVDTSTPEDGIIDLEPDPSCFSSTATTEVADDVSSTIIPCTDKCTFGDVFKLLNNIFKFFFKVLLLPLFIIMIMYAGFSYLGAQFNGMKKVELKSLFTHMIGGILLILCAWLIVYTILSFLGYTEGLVFFQN